MRVWHLQAREGLGVAYGLLDEALLAYAGALGRAFEGWPPGRYDPEVERLVRDEEERLGLFEAVEAQLLAALPRPPRDEDEGSGDRELARR